MHPLTLFFQISTFFFIGSSSFSLFHILFWKHRAGDLSVYRHRLLIVWHVNLSSFIHSFINLFFDLYFNLDHCITALWSFIAKTRVMHFLCDIWIFVLMFWHCYTRWSYWCVLLARMKYRIAKPCGWVVDLGWSQGEV